MAESPDQDDPTPEIQTPSLDLQEDNAAMHVLASNPRLWRAYLEMTDALRADGRPGLRLDFGADESMVTVTITAGKVEYAYHDETAHETETPQGKHLTDNVGFAVLDLPADDNEQ